MRKLGFSTRVFERGDGVGGTWYWNRYPGARCDVESMQYSYSFDEDLQQEWHWPEKFSAQPDILAYANHVADRFDLRRHIDFETEVRAAHFDETHGNWKIETNSGENGHRPALRYGDRLYFDGANPGYRRPQGLHGQYLSHRQLAA